jgi:4-amino-4-deoxy-L-arabinose transferase-like glycosyltransferase
VIGKSGQTRQLLIWILIGLFFLAVLLKVGLLSLGAFPFNSDEAIVGLMARHILEGKWPVFFYGQAYMGSLDATLVALGFMLFGSEVFVIRMIQILLYLGTIILTVNLSARIFKSQIAGLVSGLLLAVPTVNVTLYTTVSLGGYGEALLIGALLLLLAIQIEETPDNAIHYLLWGLFSGLGFWAFGLTIAYILPTSVIVARSLMKSHRSRWWVRGALILLAGFIGALPLIIWACENGVSVLIQELFGSAIAVDAGLDILSTLVKHLQYIFLFGITVTLGFRPPWTTDPVALLLVPLALVFWLLVFIQIFHRLRIQSSQRRIYWMIIGVMLVVILVFVLTPFGSDPSGRYFLPIYVMLTIFAGDFFAQPAFRINVRFRALVLVAVVTFNLWSNLEAATQNPPGLTTQFDAVTRVDHRFDEQLVDFLSKHGETRGYSNYWVSYPLAFESDEALIYIPRMPYHLDFRYTDRDDRYEPYQVLVEGSDRVAYITTLHPALDASIRASFRELGVMWAEEKIGDYQIFYHLSRPVRLEEIGEVWIGD